MNLIIITAIIAVCGAAKLDRTYLPPSSAKSAGGSPGSLQTPFSRNSFHNGIGLPKGSYENEFQGVVVDAAVAGTRAAEAGVTGVGAPRISYGSTDSKVGAAAFKIQPTAFRPQSDEQDEGAAQSFQGSQSFQAEGSADVDQGSQAFQPQPQKPFANGESSQRFQEDFSNSERPRASLDRTASIVRYENEVGPENYHFAFETDNGITAEENGVATNGVQAQGGFSYTGDDGQVYSISYTADEGGYRPTGDHLPTPPPIPEEILKSLEKNARDEAAGLIDDGSYDAQKYNAGSGFTETDGASGKFTDQSSMFVASETDADTSGTFNQDQTFRRPTGAQNGQRQQGSSINGQNGRKPVGFSAQGGSASSSNGATNGLNYNAQSGQSVSSFSDQYQQSQDVSADEESTSGQFGQAAFGSQGQNSNIGSFASASVQGGSSQTQSRPSFGNQKEYLPPVNKPNGRLQAGRPQNGRPLNGRLQVASSKPGQEPGNDEEGSGDIVPLGQQDLQSESRPQDAVTSFGKPVSSSNRFSSQNKFGSANNQNRPTNGQRPSYGNNVAQAQSSQSGDLNKPNEYLPPIKNNQNRRPSNRPQETINRVSQLNQQDESQSSFPSSSISGSQSQQLNGFQRPRPTQNVNRFASQAQTQFNGAAAQSTFDFDSQKATAQPTIESRPSQNENRFASQAQTQFNGAAAQSTFDFDSQKATAQPTIKSRPSQNGNRFASQAQTQFNGAAAQSTFDFDSQKATAQPTIKSRPSQNGNRFASQAQTQFNGVAAQSTLDFGSQKATVQPTIELNTPLETSNDEPELPNQATTGGITSPLRPSNGRPAQSTFANQYDNGQNGFGSQKRPQEPRRPFEQILESVSPTQSSVGQLSQNLQFGNQPQTQNSFDQNSDAQYSSSTLRPSYTHQTQGPDDSYYYRQPSKPFDVPQSSRFPSSSSGQFDRVTQQSSFAQNQFSDSLQDVPSTAVPTSLPQGSTRYPRPPSIAPTSPPSQAQIQFGGNNRGSTRYPRPPTIATPTLSQSKIQGNTVNGVTQASISSFPSQSPTQASQFNTQGQFGSRSSMQQYQFGQISQAASPSRNQQTIQSSFSQQTTAPASFSQRPSSNSFQSQAQTSNQQTDEQTDIKNEQAVSTQQYTGEIYEYNKPADTLPPPDGTPAVVTAQSVKGKGQFGQPQAQLEQTNDKEDQKTTSQFAGQPTRPQSKPQFGRPQNNFAAQTQESEEDSKPFGALAQSMFGSQTFQQGSRPQFGAQSKPQFGQTQSTYSQSQTAEEPKGDKQQFNAKIELQDEQTDAEPENPQGPKNQFGFVSACCKDNFNRKPQGQNQFGAQSQFGQSSFTGGQKQPTNGFAGNGEEFGGPRQPPRYDEQTGYHY